MMQTLVILTDFGTKGLSTSGDTSTACKRISEMNMFSESLSRYKN